MMMLLLVVKVRWSLGLEEVKERELNAWNEGGKVSIQRSI